MVVSMGILDFLFDKEKKEERKYAKLEKTLTHMYVQAAERAYIIEQLREMRTPEAISVLLQRFKESAPNSTVDMEEKERVYEVLVELGRAPDIDMVELIRAHLHKTEENVNWPLKALSDLLEYDEFVALLHDLLAGCSTEYSQNPEKKQELILRAQELQSEELARELLRFLEDMNETVRFLAVDAVIAQDRPDLSTGPLVDQLVREESLRIVQKIADAFAGQQNWQVPEEQREAVAEVLPDDYGVHDQGHIYRHRR